MTFTSCAGATVALRMAGSSSALSQGLPWCEPQPLTPNLIPSVALCLRTYGDPRGALFLMGEVPLYGRCATSPLFAASIADVNGNVDSLWGFCSCSPVPRAIAGTACTLPW